MTTNPSAPIRLPDPIRIQNSAIPRDALEGIRAASKKTGIGFHFLLAEAQRESAFQSDARHGVSSAAGLFQFTSPTWLDMIKSHGAKYGMADLAAKISVDARGRHSVSDPEARKTILDLRRNGKISAIMAAEFAKNNRTFLENKLDRPITDGDLYLAHFLGPGGAAAMLKAGDTNPNQSAADLVPEAARHNRAIFFDNATHAPRTVGEVTSLLHNTIDRSMLQFAGVDSRPEKPQIPPQRPAIYAAPVTFAVNEKSAAPAAPILTATAMLSPTSIEEDPLYTILAQGGMPPRFEAPKSMVDAGTMLVAQAEYIESRHAYSMPMPLVQAESPAEPKVVIGPNRTESAIDQIFHSLFDRRTVEG